MPEELLNPPAITQTQTKITWSTATKNACSLLRKLSPEAQLKAFVQVIQSSITDLRVDWRTQSFEERRQTFNAMREGLIEYVVRSGDGGRPENGSEGWSLDKFRNMFERALTIIILDFPIDLVAKRETSLRDIRMAGEIAKEDKTPNTTSEEKARRALEKVKEIRRKQNQASKKRIADAAEELRKKKEVETVLGLTEEDAEKELERIKKILTSSGVEQYIQRERKGFEVFKEIQNALKKLESQTNHELENPSV